MLSQDGGDGVLAPLIVHGLAEGEIADYMLMFDVYLLTPDADLGLVLRRGRDGAPLTYAPRHALALVVAAPSQARIVTEWARAAGLDDVAAVTHGADTLALLAALARRVRRSARLASDGALRLAALRTVHENLQNAYEGMRAFIQERGLLLPTLGFVAPPDADGSRLPPRLAEVTQYIPCDLRALCAVGLHVAHPAPDGADGALEVDLSSPENPALTVRWRVPYGQLQPGWVSFVFEGVGAVARSGTLLRLRFVTRAGAPPAFSLARPHLRPDRVAVADGDRLDRPLAFRAWTTLPGAPLTLTPDLWPAFQPADAPPADASPADASPAGNQPAASAHLELLAGDGFAVEDVRPLGGPLNFQPVRKLPRQRRVLVHPLGALPSVGRIARACPPGTLAIRAEVETDHADASDLEYGIALAALPLTGEDGQPTGAFRFDGPADWLVLPAKTPGTLLIELPEPLAEAADLYLICRCPPGGTSDWGWAHFNRLTLIGTFAPDAFALQNGASAVDVAG